jgi:hypothetical protein
MQQFLGCNAQTIADTIDIISPRIETPVVRRKIPELFEVL